MASARAAATPPDSDSDSDSSSNSSFERDVCAFEADLVILREKRERVQRELKKLEQDIQEAMELIDDRNTGYEEVVSEHNKCYKNWVEEIHLIDKKAAVFEAKYTKFKRMKKELDELKGRSAKEMR